MNHEQTAYIGLGANLGQPLVALQQAIKDLTKNSGIKLLRQSSFYSSAPVDSSGPDYINAVIAIATRLSAEQLLLVLQQIELDAGRTRPYYNAPRILDLDLLLYSNEQINTSNLTVPHPRWKQRAFVLYPLQEIAPQLVSNKDLSVVKNQQITKITHLQ